MTSYPDTKMKVNSYLLPVSDAIKDAENKAPIHFQFLPKVSGDSREANYDAPGGGTLGRAEQFQVYKSSSNKKLSITAQFAATGEHVRDGFQGSATFQNGEVRAGVANEVWVQRQVKRIQALCEPIYNRDTLQNTTSFNAPPLVLFTYGLRYINVPVVVNAVGYEIESNAMIDGFGALPQVVSVSIQLTTNYPYGFVPGYLNTINLFSNSGVINANEHNFDGINNNNFGNLQDTLVDKPARTLAASKINLNDVTGNELAGATAPPGLG